MIGKHMYLNNTSTKNIQGMILIILASLCYAALNCIIKHLGQEISPLSLVFYRNIGAVFTLLPMMVYYKVDLMQFFQKEMLAFNVVRGSLGFIGLCFWFTALSKLPVTECVAISFTTPLFITALAALLLRETIHYHKLVMLFIGFSGAIIIVSPSWNNFFDSHAIFALFAALLWATSAIAVKAFVNKSHPIAVVFFTACINLILSTPAGLKYATPLSLYNCTLVLTSSVLTNIAQVLMAFAYKKAPITVVIPFDFLRLIFAALFAFILFGEEIRYRTIVGAALIISSTSIIGWLNIRSKKRRQYMGC